MKTLEVDLGHRSYPIHIGSQLLSNSDLLKPHIQGKSVVIVTNETVAPLYLGTLKTQLSNYRCDSIVLKDGEAHKNLETLNTIYTRLLEQRYDRKTTLIALGGGVVGDIAGYAAASYQRGIPFIQIPTTLLAQVDSSVGGKTAVNHPLGKNMIGAFYQPQCVLADTEVLKTLPPRELAAGLAEVIKYGLLGDREFLLWVKDNMDALKDCDNATLTTAIERSCQMKAEIVAADEREGGQRALLNLGHTFGHAIETEMGYGEWLHGEAVGAGMVMAAEMSRACGWIKQEDLDLAKEVIAAADLPTQPPSKMTPDTFLQHMARDKKVIDGSLRLVLLKALGHAVVTADFDQAALMATLERE
ncbi:3-dehydroquinate synthase [gamma proteobacterium HTCC5015]|nr:3-dehydroquinate synthase [gamma proteobacterium HTCC5015]